MIVSSAAGATSRAATGEPPLQPGERVEASGLDRDLRTASGLKRVRVLLRRQPLVKSAARAPVRDLIDAPDTDALKPDARAHPRSLAAAEKRRALRLEQRFELARDRLEPAARETVAELRELEEVIRRLGGEPIGAELAPALLIARLPGRALGGLAARAEVQAISPAPRERPLLDSATPSTGAPAWWAAGHTGGSGADDIPTDVATLGEAQEPTHPAFAGVELEDLGGGITNHGTHVGGVIASQDATYQGAAPGIDALIGATEPRALGFSDSTGPGAEDPAEVLNRSFGSPAGDDDDESPQDVLASLFDVGFAAAGGNDNVDGSPTVNNLGRNQLVMAYYFDNGNTVSTDDVISGNSSNGPTPGGRKKPDLIAPGSQIVSPDLLGGAPNGYTSVSGSSFSAPFGAAALALLEGAGIGDSAAQRAILVNSARDWDGVANNITHGWTPGSQGSWQPEVGWGALDLDAALADRANYELAAVEEGSARFFRGLSTSGSKTTLAWELRGTWDGYPENGVAPIVYTTSNLDLRQYRADTLAEVPPPADPGHGGGPDAVDPNDNIEQVRAPAGGGEMIYKISSESTIEGLAAEPFAIASTEALTPLVNPEVEPFGSAAGAGAPVNCATDVEITTRLRNQSPDLDAGDADASLQLPAGVELRSGEQTEEVAGGKLVSGAQSEEIAWTVRPTSHGTKRLEVLGSGDVMDETFTAAEEVELEADCEPPTTSIGSGPEGATNDSSPSFRFSATEPSDFACSIDGAAFAPCSSPFTAGGLPDGDHSFAVRATDGAGNEGGASTRSFTVDTVPPATRFTSGPERTTRDDRPSFAFTAPGASAFGCSLDGDAFQPCTSPTRIGPLDDGEHSLRVRSRDQAGNTEQRPARRSFEVDTRIKRPTVRARRKQRLRRRGYRIRVRAGAGEPVKVRAKGRVALPGRNARLKPISRRADPGERRRLELKPRRARDRRRLRRALDRRKHASAEVTVRLSDAAGNRVRRRLSVRLRSR